MRRVVPGRGRRKGGGVAVGAGVAVGVRVGVGEGVGVEVGAGETVEVGVGVRVGVGAGDTASNAPMSMAPAVGRRVAVPTASGPPLGGCQRGGQRGEGKGKAGGEGGLAVPALIKGRPAAGSRFPPPPSTKRGLSPKRVPVH